MRMFAHTDPSRFLQKEVYRTLAKVQAENEEKERRLRAKAAKKSTKNKKVVFQDPPVAGGEAVEPVYESPAAAARARAAEAAAAAALAADSDEEGDVASGGVAESKCTETVLVGRGWLRVVLIPLFCHLWAMISVRTAERWWEAGRRWCWRRRHFHRRRRGRRWQWR